MAVLLTILLALQDDEIKPGTYCVTVRSGAFYTEASSVSEVLRAAKYGEKVTVTGTAKNGKQVWAVCEIDGGKKAYISAKSLLPKGEFKKQVEGSEEDASTAAEGYRGSRFDPKTEEGFSKEKNLGGAYQKVDAWCGRPEARDPGGSVVKTYEPGKPGWKMNRPEMLIRLRQFRRDGKLGEFAGGN